MYLNNSRKAPFQKTALIRKDSRRGGWTVTIINQDAWKYPGMVAPKFRMGTYVSVEAAIKAVRDSCASFKRARVK